ncbi:MAG: hypothetical protein ACYC5F_02105 [Thermoleophilia bacterium]
MGTSKRGGVRVSFLVILVSLIGVLAAQTALAAQGPLPADQPAPAGQPAPAALAGASDGSVISGPAAAIAPVCGQPPLSISLVRAYWPSYADYVAGRLSVDDRITNNGPGEALYVYVVGTVNTNGVIAGNIPIDVGTIAGSGSAPLTVEYTLPQTLLAGGSFKSTVYVFAGDACGNYFNYPGPYPGDCT